MAVSHEERSRFRLVREDYRSWESRLHKIASGAPAGDPKKRALFVSSFPTVAGLKLEGVLSLATRLAGLTPYIGELWSYNLWSRRYHRLFGNQSFAQFRKFLAKEPVLLTSPEVREFAQSPPSVKDLLHLTYRNVDIGRVALSNILNRLKFVKDGLDRPEHGCRNPRRVTQSSAQPSRGGKARGPRRASPRAIVRKGPFTCGGTGWGLPRPRHTVGSVRELPQGDGLRSQAI